MASIRHRPMRLPPVRVLRVKNPNAKAEDSCTAVMSSLLACWASSGGVSTTTCHTIENNLRKCMDGPKPPDPPKNNINFHLSRMYKHIVTAQRKKT